MIFKTFAGKLTLSLHSPNSGGEHPRLFPIEERAGSVVITTAD